MPVMTEIAPLCVLDMLWDGWGRGPITSFFLPVLFLSVFSWSCQILTACFAQLGSQILLLFCAFITNINYLNTSIIWLVLTLPETAC